MTIHEFIKDIIKEEQAKNNNFVKVAVVNQKENFKYILENELIYFLKSSFSIKKDFVEVNFGGDDLAFYSRNEQLIKVFLSRIKSDAENNKELYLFSVLITIFHEYAHLEYFKKMSEKEVFDNKVFIAELEDYIIDYIKNAYNKYYDNYFCEIYANYMAGLKAEHYLKKYPKLYKKLESDIYYFNTINKILINNYDIEQMIYKTFNTDMAKEELLEYLKEKYGNDISDWFNLSNFKKFELENLYTILSSRFLLELVNIEDLTSEYSLVLRKAFDYSISKTNLIQDKNNKLLKEIDESSLLDKKSKDYLELLLNKKIKRNNLKIKYLGIKINEIESNLKKQTITKTLTKN